MPDSQKKNFVIASLLVVIILLSVLLVLVFTGTIKLDNKTNNEPMNENDILHEETKASYTYNSIKGLYGYESTDNKEYYIYLDEKGVFSYSIHEGDIPYEQLGNYILDGKQVKLNYLIKWGAQDAAYAAMSETATITINDNGSLNLSTQPGDAQDESIILTKVTGTKEEQLLASKTFDVYHILDVTIKNFINKN